MAEQIAVEIFSSLLLVREKVQKLEWMCQWLGGVRLNFFFLPA
jgi:hypothetical protein